jgi:hypothetical protein
MLMREVHRRSVAAGALAVALLAAAAVCALVLASPRHQLSYVLLGGDDWLGAPFAGTARRNTTPTPRTVGVRACSHAAVAARPARGPFTRCL